MKHGAPAALGWDESDGSDDDGAFLDMGRENEGKE